MDRLVADQLAAFGGVKRHPDDVLAPVVGALDALVADVQVRFELDRADDVAQAKALGLQQHLAADVAGEIGAGPPLARREQFVLPAAGHVEEPVVGRLLRPLRLRLALGLPLHHLALGPLLRAGDDALLALIGLVDGALRCRAPAAPPERAVRRRLDVGVVVDREALPRGLLALHQDLLVCRLARHPRDRRWLLVGGLSFDEAPGPLVGQSLVGIERFRRLQLGAGAVLLGTGGTRLFGALRQGRLLDDRVFDRLRQFLVRRGRHIHRAVVGRLQFGAHLRRRRFCRRHPRGLLDRRCIRDLGLLLGLLRLLTGHLRRDRAGR